jgi:hypothetical protein
MEPFGPIAKGIVSRSNDSRRVIDLSATRKVKERTGKVVPIALDTSSRNEAFEKHVDEALRMGNPDGWKPSK